MLLDLGPFIDIYNFNLILEFFSSLNKSIGLSDFCFNLLLNFSDFFCSLFDGSLELSRLCGKSLNFSGDFSLLLLKFSLLFFNNFGKFFFSLGHFCSNDSFL